MTDTKKALLEFSALTGVSGLESEAAEYGKSLLSNYGEVSVSPLGSIICVVKKPGPGGIHLMLDAHMDEVGLAVAYIEEKGFLRVCSCGNADRRMFLASPVTVHTKNGALAGVVCSVPPHLSKGGEKNKKADEIYIDIGSKDATEAGEAVALGDRITFDSRPRELLNGLVSGKALDDRAGCVALLKALDYLGGAPEIGLSVVFSSMEEVGGHGAKTAAFELNPTHAVAVEVSFALTPDEIKEECGELKKGPMIGFAPILDSALSRWLTGISKELGLPYQTEVMNGRTGTNADVIAATRGGIKTALLSIPQKYMHTPIETVAIEDVENTGRLLAEFIRELAKEGR